jgi:transcriptional regulator with XRE-family HTH domain
MEIGVKKNIELLVDKKAIGQRMKKLRGDESRQAFAQKFDVGINTVVRYENAKTLPDISFLLTVANYYNISVNWLLYGDNQSEPFKGKALITDSPLKDQNTINGQDAESIQQSLLSLSFNSFDDLWEEYKNCSEAVKGWIQVEIIKRFPEFVEWARKKDPFILEPSKEYLALTKNLNDKL